MSSGRYNVIVLIFDTLRSDRLGCYDDERRTPAFEDAANNGTVFESAFGAGPGTPISHASMYTGRYPSEHGVTGGYMNLPEDEAVMAEWFNTRGYDTFGIAGPSKMGSDWGFDRGFDEFFEPYHDFPDHTSITNVYKSVVDRRFGRYFLRKVTRGGSDQTRYKFELLRDRVESDLDRPFFALCNVSTVHAPYDPPRPYKERATPGFSRPPLFLLEFLLNDSGSIDDDDVRLDRVMNMQTTDGVGRFLSDPSYLNEKEIRLLRRWYDSAVSYLDDELQRFLDYYLENLRDDTILVLTADHGEQLGEHGLWEHSHYLYDETLKIPLIMVGPGIPTGNRRSDLVSHVDLFSTLCDLCNLDSPEETSATPLFRSGTRDAVYMEYGERDAENFSNNTGHGRYLNQDQLRRFSAGRKAIRTQDYRFEITSNGTEHLFELPTQNTVPVESAGVVSSLREQLVNTLGREFGHWPSIHPDDLEVDPEVKENLEELGYID